MANNNTNTSLKYESRKFYKYFYFNDITNKIDFWNELKYYGKLDKRGIPFYLNKNYLKSITSPTTTNSTTKQSTLNIVSDSYLEMVEEFKKADLYLSIPKSKYNPLKIKKSTLLFETEYKNYLNKLLDTWYKQYKNQINNEIITFYEFINLFLSTFANANAIITQSAYLTSYLCSPLITGLAIEFSDSKHDDDTKKINDFIRDENFEFFVNTVGKYGFMVDKNAPWRIVYNLTTDYATQKMNLYNVDNLDAMLSQYYVYPHLTEYKVIKEQMINFYNLSLNTKPTIQKTEFCNKKKQLINTTISKNIDTEIDDLTWIKIYYFIRCKEEQIGLTQPQFNADIRKIEMIYNSYDLNNVLEWILNKTKKFIDGGTNPSYNQYVTVTKNKSNNLSLYNLSL